MSDGNSKQDRRSTRLSISIPVVISGDDAAGKSFTETVRTLIVNKHGGKIATAHRVNKGTELTIENRALGVVAKATVVWMGGKHEEPDVHHLGVQLLEAQNVWGIVFPPEDWSQELQGEESAVGAEAPAQETRKAGDETCPTESAGTSIADSPISSLAAEEISIRLLQELQESADTYAREFQDRMKQLTQRLGLEMEFDLRERMARTNPRAVTSLEEEVKVLREDLIAFREEIRKLEGKIQHLQNGLQSSKDSSVLSPTPLQDARRQLTTLANSVVESMNRAAQAGLNDYRVLLRKENQKSAARLRAGTDDGPPAAAGTPREV